MAKIEYADRTFTTREPHEVDPQATHHHAEDLVDHGPVITTGLPDGHPTKALGIEEVQSRAVTEQQPDNPEMTPEPATKPRRAHRRSRAGASKATEVREAPRLESKVEESGSVPQGRIGVAEHAPGRALEQRERISHDND